MPGRDMVVVPRRVRKERYPSFQDSDRCLLRNGRHAARGTEKICRGQERRHMAAHIRRVGRNQHEPQMIKGEGAHHAGAVGKHVYTSVAGIRKRAHRHGSR